MRIALPAGMLSRRISGYTVYGEPVTLSRAFPFIFSATSLIFATLTSIFEVHWRVQDSAARVW